MQTPLVSTSARKIPRDSALYGGQLSIIRFAIAIAMLLITLAAFFAQNGGHSAAHSAPASSEFSSGMPLP